LVAFEILPQATTSPNVNDAFAATTTTTGMHSHTSGAATTTQKQKLGVVGHRTYTQKNVEYDRYVTVIRCLPRVSAAERCPARCKIRSRRSNTGSAGLHRARPA
jgi:hypothetical protein